MNPRKFTRSKPSLRDLQAHLLANAPDGGMVRPPAFMSKTPRAQSTKPRRHLEDELQLACAQYLKLLTGTLWWSTPNHLYIKNPTAGALGYLAKQKRMGMRQGVSDILILFRNRDGASTLCCAELKVGYKNPDEEQQRFLDDANALGAYTACVKSLDDLQALLRAAGHPMVRKTETINVTEPPRKFSDELPW